jgi:hypothetical protein
MLRVRRWLAPCGVACVLAVGAMHPSFGRAASSSLTASLPDGVRVDLAAHFSGHVALVVALVAGASMTSLVAFAVSVLLAFALEAVQSTPLAPGRMASFEDFAAGSTGAGLGASICALAKGVFSGGGDPAGLEGPLVAAVDNQERTESLDP